MKPTDRDLVDRLVRQLASVAGAILALAVLLSAAVASAASSSSALPDPQASADGVVGTIATYGPVIGGMYLAYAIASSLVSRYASSSWLAQGKRLALATGVLGVSGAALQAEIAGSPWTVVAAAAGAMAFKLLTPTVSGAVPSPASLAKPATIVTLGGLLVIAGLSSGGAQVAGCGPKTDALAHDIWTNCLAPERAQAVATLTPLAESVILAAASADGKLIDTSKLLAATSRADLLTEAGVLLECAMASAVTDLLTPAPQVAGTSSSPLVLDPAALRDAWSRVAPAGSRFRTQHGDL